MSQQIAITVFENPDLWLRENLGSMEGDGVCPVLPYSGINLGGDMEYEDIEEGSRKTCSWADHLDALRLLSEQIGKTLFVGGLNAALELTDLGNWDSEVVDAYWQLVYHKQVIYG